MTADIGPRLGVDRDSFEVAARPDEASLVHEMRIGEYGRAVRPARTDGHAGTGHAFGGPLVGQRRNRAHRAIECVARRDELHGGFPTLFEQVHEPSADVVTIRQRLAAEAQRDDVGKAVDDRRADDSFERGNRAIADGHEADRRRKERGPSAVEGELVARLGQAAGVGVAPGVERPTRRAGECDAGPLVPVRSQAGRERHDAGLRRGTYVGVRTRRSDRLALAAGLWVRHQSDLPSLTWMLTSVCNAVWQSFSKVTARNACRGSRTRKRAADRRRDLRSTRVVSSIAGVFLWKLSRALPARVGMHHHDRCFFPKED